MTAADNLKTCEVHRDLTVLAWVVVGILGLNIIYFVGYEVGAAWKTSSGAWLAIFNAWWLGLITAMPTILIAFVAADFAALFERCSKDHVFTEENVKTLDKAAYGLIGAGIWAALISPTLQAWINLDTRGLSLELGDLALAVTLMGVMLHGLSLVFKDAVAVKAENDEFV